MRNIDSCKPGKTLVAFLFSFILLALTDTAKANNNFIPITGTVTGSSDNQPLEGVSVTIKGKDGGTSTNATGNYSLADAGENDILIFSFVGYQTQEVPVRGRSAINVVLQLETGMLVETIVTANAIRRDKKSLGYSAPVVRSDELIAGRSTSPLNALQGKVAG